MAPQNGNCLTIAFDTWTMARRFRNMGIYVYASKLLSCFREIAAQHCIECKPLVSSAVPNDANAFQAIKGFRPHETGLLRLDRAWRFGGACFSAFLSDADILFCPSGNTLPLTPLVPVVTTIHDLTPVVLPAYPKRIARSLRFALGNSARFSRAVVTDSICSKNDLMNIFGLPESKVHVVYLGYDEAVFNVAPSDPAARDVILQRLGIDRPYIFHHGTIQPRKNLKRLIDAYRLVLSRNRNLQLDLVLVGELGWQYEEILVAVNSTQQHGRVILAGPQSDLDLATLLKAATLVVIPSLYEGFCLPMVEAMACGVPTIASNASCLPEVSGGVLEYFDPHSDEDMADCVERALENSTLRQVLSRKGKARSDEFSWRRCAEQTLTILKSAAAS